MAQWAAAPHDNDTPESGTDVVRQKGLRGGPRITDGGMSASIQKSSSGDVSVSVMSKRDGTTAGKPSKTLAECSYATSFNEGADMDASSACAEAANS